MQTEIERDGACIAAALAKCAPEAGVAERDGALFVLGAEALLYRDAIERHLRACDPRYALEDLQWELPVRGWPAPYTARQRTLAVRVAARAPSTRRAWTRALFAAALALYVLFLLARVLR